MEKFSAKFQNQAPWDKGELKETLEEGKVGNAITEALKKWNLNITRFYPQLEDKLRQNNDSYNIKTLKQTYQSAVKMTATSPTTMEDFQERVVEGGSRGTLHLTNVTEF